MRKIYYWVICEFTVDVIYLDVTCPTLSCTSLHDHETPDVLPRITAFPAKPKRCSLD